MELYPAYFVILGLLVYAAAYWLYAKKVDKTVWEVDPKRTTPAHMYTDGVEFFPTSKAVMFGFQYKGIAALGPILGPFVAITFGWLPALLWILIGNFFIGWIHDYSSIMISVRNEGKSFGPLSYKLISPRARTSLLGFLWFYMLIIAAVFVFLCGLFMTQLPASVTPTIFTAISGIVVGALLYRAKLSIITTTVVGILIFMVGLWLGVAYPIVYPSIEVWMVVTLILVLIGAVTPIIWYTQPVNYVAFYPCFIGVVVIIVGALLSPVWNIPLMQPAYNTWYTPAVGPIWPILFVSIACGAISGWHSLIGSSGTAKQLDVETDALPVGAGSMLWEGILALSATAAYMVLPAAEAAKLGNWPSFIQGATLLTQNLFGGVAAAPTLNAFFATFLNLYAITVTMILFRFWRMTSAELSEGVPALRTIFANKYVATVIGMIIAFIFAWTGSWINLWLLFGGSNQLVAGLALLLASIYLVRQKKSTGYTLWPSVFMIITCEAALIWIAYVFLRAVTTGQAITRGMLAGYPGAALALNAIFAIISVVLIVLGIVVAYDGYKAYARGKEEATST